MLLVLLAAAANAADIRDLSDLAQAGRLLMLRHANAPGTGDPPNFTLADCSTQRKLDAAGRVQAASLGRRLAQAGVGRARVYSSQWCRCLETARLLDLGAVEQLPALNSFYPQLKAQEATLARLRAFMASLPVDGPPVVMVTHQFTIAELSGGGTPSGGGSLFQLNATGSPRLLGSIAPQ